MILADSFTNSAIAREMELQTTINEAPLIVQFASSNPLQLAHAALLVAPYCAGIDLNCGCPQSWACKEGKPSFSTTSPIKVLAHT